MWFPISQFDGKTSVQLWMSHLLETFPPLRATLHFFFPEVEAVEGLPLIFA